MAEEGIVGGGSLAEARKKRTDPAYVPSDEDKEILKLVDERISWSADNPTRDQLFRQFFEQIAFCAGIQWLEYSQATRRFAKWSAPAWFPTPVSNEMAPRLKGMVARLLSVEPAGRVRPASGDAADREAASLGDDAIPHIYAVTEEMTVREYGALYAGSTGTVIFKDTFDPGGGKQLRVPRTNVVETPVMQQASQCDNDLCGSTGGPQEQNGSCYVCGAGAMAPTQVPRTFGDGSPVTTVSEEPELDEAGQPIVDTFHEGELRSDARMLFNFFWDTAATRLKEAQWCGEAVYTPLDQIDQMYPDLGPYVGEEQTADTHNNYLTSLISLVGTSTQGNSSQTGGTGVAKGGAVLKWYEERPTLKRPEGLLAVVADGVLLHSGPLPIVDEQGNCANEFSFEDYRLDLVPGRFAGRTPIEDMVPLQRRVNGIDAQVILNRKTLSCPWVLAPKGSGLKPGQVLMRPGTTVVYNFIGVGSAPQVVKGEPLPDQVYKEREACLEAMDRLAQDPRISLAEMPQGVKSGIGLNFAKEQGDAASMPALKRWGDCIARRDSKRLMLMQRYYREERAIKLFGIGSDWRVRYFKGADLRGNTDVVIDPGSLAPKSRSAYEQSLHDAMDGGLIDISDPMQRQAMLQELGLTAFESDIGPDYRRAMKENGAMDLGTPVEVTPVDNDMIHLQIHIGRQKDPSFDALSPEAQQAHQMHKDMHMQRMLGQLAKQDAAGAGPAGAQAGNAPPGGGPPGAPPGASPGAPPPGVATPGGPPDGQAQGAMAA